MCGDKGTEMRQVASWVVVFCLVVSASMGSQMPGHEATKFNLLGITNGVTKSGASWDGTIYETANGSRVHLTIVHLDSPEGAKNEYADWLKLKGVRIISKGKVQGKLATKPGQTEYRAIVRFAVPSECNEGTAILATAGTSLRIIQSCSSKAAFEFERQKFQTGNS
jgi:hypothetical protein